MQYQYEAKIKKILKEKFPNNNDWKPLLKYFCDNLDKSLIEYQSDLDSLLSTLKIKILRN